METMAPIVTYNATKAPSNSYPEQIVSPLVPASCRDGVGEGVPLLLPPVSDMRLHRSTLPPLPARGGRDSFCPRAIRPQRERELRRATGLA